MKTKRNLTQWFYLLIGMRAWELVGTNYYPIYDSNNHYYVGQFGITEFKCTFSKAKKSIKHDVVIYDEPY
jgi:hypothetical protein